MAKIIVLGAGLVGSVMAQDLAQKHEVTSVDLNEKALKPLSPFGIHTIHADLSHTATIERLIKDYDLVVGAVPGFLGYQTLETVIRSQKNVVDISFFPENPFELDDLAQEMGVIAVMDCGVAPGMGNIILGHHNLHMKVTDYECLVGGLPEIREWPYEYKAVFSPIDVIEEYIRPARYVQHHQLITKEALSDAELLDFDGVGTLESWNSDGLRTLIDTMPHIPNMIEKTLRYPGCVEYLKVLRASGFFSYEEIDVNGQKVKPIDITAKLLFPKWQLKEGEKDFTVMQIKLSGEENGQNVSYQYNLLDRYQNDTISMARTTGYTCTAVAQLIVNGTYQKIGISPPEYLGEHYDFINAYLKERNVIYQQKKTI